ncbi:MAG: response regulator [Chitinophagales bacterium]|nr:response regulator [Chitinophagales bacterium]
MSAKLLLVDDEPNILLSLDFLMRKNGFQVLIARNGTEALELLNEHTPDLVILDIMMPDVDGYQICQHIKSDAKLKSTKVIFLSAKSKESDIAKGLELGADAYMTKPFANKALLEKVKELIS